MLYAGQGYRFNMPPRVFGANAVEVPREPGVFSDHGRIPAILFHSPHDDLTPLGHVIPEYGWRLLLIEHEQPDRIGEVIKEVDTIVVLAPKPSMSEQRAISIIHRLPSAPCISKSGTQYDARIYRAFLL